LEQKSHAYGHVHSTFQDGFTWDEGPHVSFTKHDYVKDLFAKSVDGGFDEYAVRTTNYFHGHWIDHPAQSALYQVPEPLREQCLRSFLETREEAANETPHNYAEWLDYAFGPVFARTFPAAYTRKYWGCEADALTTDWVGGRVFSPSVQEIIDGSKGPLDRSTHYITQVRYPRQGGYQSFASLLHAGARIHYHQEIVRINLEERRLWTATGAEYRWERLINTLPLPTFIRACAKVPTEIVEAADNLACTSVFIINVTAAHPTRRPENWIYIYDEDKYSTRINCTEKLTAGNAPMGHTGVQVEVYISKHRPLGGTPQAVAKQVISELVEMGLVDNEQSVTSVHTVLAPWANVTFTHGTDTSLDAIWGWLEQYGLQRETDDCHPLCDWNSKLAEPANPTRSLHMAGRFGQWKYFWSDDCVLRGKLMGEG
jgi:protoporphyrinogen oxidase